MHKFLLRMTWFSFRLQRRRSLRACDPQRHRPAQQADREELQERNHTVKIERLINRRTIPVQSLRIAQLLLWTHNIFQGLSCYKNIFYVQVILLILLLVIMILKQDWLFDWMEILKYTHLFSGVQFFSIRIQLWDKMQYVRHVQRFQSCVGPVQHLPLLISYWAEHM